jgi:hypothetical protein
MRVRATDSTKAYYDREQNVAIDGTGSFPVKPTSLIRALIGSGDLVEVEEVVAEVTEAAKTLKK